MKGGSRGSGGVGWLGEGMAVGRVLGSAPAGRLSPCYIRSCHPETAFHLGQPLPVACLAAACLRCFAAEFSILWRLHRACYCCCC